MTIRRVASLTTFLSFVVVLFSGLVLYCAPPGSVGNWFGWGFWGLSKDGWEHMHIDVSLLLLVASGLHIFFNWRSILKYIKDGLSKMKGLRSEATVALILVAFFVVQSVLGAQPVASVTGFGEALGKRAETTIGKPPTRHAERMPLDGFCRFFEIELGAAKSALDKAGVTVTDDTLTLKEIAKANNIWPNDIYLAIKDVGAPGDSQ